MNTDNINTGSWERIQNGFQDTERLLGQKRYNECMIRARQTLEFMVKCLCERFDVSEATLVDMIDALYENGIINKTTCEHYHKIRMIGNKAVHEEDNLAYNAGQAYHLLSQEIYTFANDFTGKKKKPLPPPEGRYFPGGRLIQRATFPAFQRQCLPFQGGCFQSGRFLLRKAQKTPFLRTGYRSGKPFEDFYSDCDHYHPDLYYPPGSPGR